MVMIVYLCCSDHKFRTLESKERQRLLNEYLFLREANKRLKEENKAYYDLGVEKTIDAYCKLHCKNRKCDEPNQPDCEIRQAFYDKVRESK